MPAVLRVSLIRLGILVLSLAIASVAIFALCSLLPGDVAEVMLGTQADPAAVAQLRAELGIDRPAPVRYLSWMAGLLHGDFGHSYVTGQPVAGQILTRLPVTAWLVVFGMLLALLIAIPLGMLAAIHNRRAAGLVVSGLSQVGLAVPAFWAGILLVWLFAVSLRWLPANGYVPLLSDPGQWAAHLVLPVISLAVVQSAVLVRYIRSAFIEVIDEDYFRTARSVGWTTMGALLRHGLRNAALSVVTVLGLQLSTLLVGAIVIESVFTLPGLGSLLLTAVSQRDLILVQGTVLVLVAAVLVINSVVEWSYVLIDPRLRAQDGGAPVHPAAPADAARAPATPREDGPP